MNTTDILNKLKEGNQRFVSGAGENNKNQKEQREPLVSGQSPYAIVLSCADSRLPPETIFDSNLGELFVVRVAGNIANTDSIASIEYAVAHLKTKFILVLGHQSCGAVTAALGNDDMGYNLNHLLAQIKPAVVKANTDDIAENVKANCSHTVDELVDRSSIISNAVNSEGVTIAKAYYNLDSGQVDFLD